MGVVFTLIDRIQNAYQVTIINYNSELLTTLVASGVFRIFIDHFSGPRRAVGVRVCVSGQ